MEIIYYAADGSMGDTSPEDCEKFREWAQRELRERYPSMEITVTDKPSSMPVTTDDLENEEEIIDFCSRLWDSCPWDFS